MNTMRPQLPARCLVFTLEALPFLLILITTVGWLFFALDPPSTTTKASLLWMAPILISTFSAISFVTIRGLYECDCFPMSPTCSLQRKSTLQQAVHDLVCSLSCTVSIYLSSGFIWWKCICGIFGELKPYNPHGEEKGPTAED